MENLTNNPNLSIDIGQKILQPLDDASLQSCRLVNSTLKRMVDPPRFWIQKLEKKGLNPQFKSETLNDNCFIKENLLNWRKLINEVENTELEKNVTLCLIKMHQNFPKKSQDQVPINFTSDVGNASLVKLILGQIDLVAKSISMQVEDFIGTNAFDQTPILNATWGNHIEVVKLLMNSTDNPNAPRNDGTTPISIASQNNHLEIVKLLEDRLKRDTPMEMEN